MGDDVTVGETVGTGVAGDRDGAEVGRPDGDKVGLLRVGTAVGANVASAKLGAVVDGAKVGAHDGYSVGGAVGYMQPSMNGAAVGTETVGGWVSSDMTVGDGVSFVSFGGGARKNMSTAISTSRLQFVDVR